MNIFVKAEPKQAFQIYEVIEKIARNKEQITKLRSDICPPVWLWVMDDILKEETWSKRNLVPQKDSEDTVWNDNVSEKMKTLYT